MTTPDYKAEARERKRQRQKIKQAREQTAREVNQLGNDFLAARRELGIPDPDDPQAFGLAMVKFTIGLRALALAVHDKQHDLEKVPDSLRRWLSNPITGQPATDSEISMYADMLTEHERNQK